MTKISSFYLPVELEMINFNVKSVRGIYEENMFLLRVFSQEEVSLGSLGFGFLVFQNIVRHKLLCQKSLE